MAITNLIGTKWVFNETPSTSNATYDLYFTSNGEHHTSLILNFWGQPVIGYSEQATAYVNGEWKNENYKTIEITGGLDGDNADLIAWLVKNATQIINLTNTTWTLKNDLDFTIIGEDQYNFKVNFISNGEEFDTLTIRWMGGAYGLEWKNSINSTTKSLHFFGGLTSDFNTYRTITITGGDDVENATLIAWLETNNMAPPEFTEVKVPLKIYADLTAGEFSMLEKDEDSFYLVDEVGVYKGDKLIAKNTKVPTGFTYTYEGEELEYSEGDGSFSVVLDKAFNNKPTDAFIYFAAIKHVSGNTVKTPILSYGTCEFYMFSQKLVSTSDSYGLTIRSGDENVLNSDYISSITLYVISVFEK